MTGKPHIVFVDDEPRILGAMRRMLRTHRDTWEMSFCEGGDAALVLLREQPCDVIVSDYRMPGMTGAQLLQQVREEFPGTARVILSGQTSEDSLLDILVLAHDFLTKPTSPEQLVEVVERLVPADGRPRLDRVDVQSLPSPPKTLSQLVDALNSPTVSAQQIGAIIEEDPAPAAKVLQLVNSSAYNVGRKVSNVGQAVALLGLPAVRDLVLMHDLIRTFDTGGTLPAAWLDALTRHAVETSRLCRMLAEGQDWESHAFTAGLLAEIGQLVLAVKRPQELSRVLDVWRAGGGEMHDAEQEVGAIGHVDAAVDVLRFWGLPLPVVDAVAGHTGSDAPLDDPVGVVALAHRAVESAFAPVCGAPMLDLEQLPPRERDIISRWLPRDRTDPR